MTSTKLRKTTAAIVAAAVIGVALAPTGASAKGGKNHHHGHGFGYGAAAFGGALLLGTIVASSSRSYAVECWTEKRTRYDVDGYPYLVKVRVCD